MRAAIIATAFLLAAITGAGIAVLLRPRPEFVATPSLTVDHGDPAAGDRQPPPGILRIGEPSLLVIVPDSGMCSSRQDIRLFDCSASRATRC